MIKSLTLLIRVWDDLIRESSCWLNVEFNNSFNSSSEDTFISNNDNNDLNTLVWVQYNVLKLGSKCSLICNASKLAIWLSDGTVWSADSKLVICELIQVGQLQVGGFFPKYCQTKLVANALFINISEGSILNLNIPSEFFVIFLKL